MIENHPSEEGLIRPAPGTPARPVDRLPLALSALAVPNFRLFVSSNVIAMTAMWMQRIAQDWLVFEMTGSAAAVGVTIAVQFAPVLLFGLWGGVIVDRYSQRRLMMITQSASSLLSLALALLVLTGAVELWHVFIIAFVVGLVTVVDKPTRQVFINELVGPQHLSNAISLGSTVFQFGSLVGPALSGLLIVAVGVGWSFAANALACALTVFMLSRLNASALRRAPAAPRAKGQLREGMRHVRSEPVIFWSFTMLGFMSVFAFSLPVLLTAYANDVFHVGAGGYGLFNSLAAVGALVGAFFAARRTRVRLRTVILTAGLLGLLQACAGLMPNEVAFGVMLACIGASNLLFGTATQSLIQMSSAPHFRGRVVAVYSLVLLGGQAIGGPTMGWIVEHFGPHAAMIISGLVPTAAAVAIALVLASRHRLKLSVRLYRGPGRGISIVSSGRKP